MDNPYFLAMDEDGSLPGSSVNRALAPFRNYLDNAINAIKTKEVSCHWRRLHNQQWQAELHLRVYRVTPWTDVEISPSEQGWFAVEEDLDEEGPLDESFMPETDEPVSIGKGSKRRKIFLTDADIRQQENQVQLRLGDISDVDRISWLGYHLRVRSLDISFDPILQLILDGQPVQATHIDGRRYRIPEEINSSALFLLCGKPINFRLVNTFEISSLGPSTHYYIEGNNYFLFANQKPENVSADVQDITSEWMNQLSPSHLTADGKALSEQQWKCEVSSKKNTSMLTLTPLQSTQSKLPAKLTPIRQPSIHLVCKLLENTDHWIQLLDNEDDSIDQQAGGISELDHFFSENIRIQNGDAKHFEDGYQIINAHPDEKQLLLGVKGNRGSVVPKHDRLKVKVDIAQLIKQKMALQSLMNRPALAHQPLVKLFQERDKTQWGQFNPIPEQEINWEVLTDTSFDGCDRQRQFVCKALATPDFAILDGPPGTGKTTTILELIIQLVRREQRVLLSASTHAAINNVLERVKENALEEEIFALRIGDENRATGVEDLQYDNQLTSCRQQTDIDISEQILVDASNLVCGTTMGILRLFNNKNIDLEAGEPVFDVLIIDECSKTTFQEFMVPARFTKRWVLVGDERQLSPFTDREQITANLDKLLLKEQHGKKAAVYLNPDIQKACFYLQELFPYKDRFIIPVNFSLLKALFEEITHRNDPELEQILFVSKHKLAKMESPCWQTPTQLKGAPYHLYSHNLLFIDQDLLEELQDSLPDDAILLTPNWPASSHAFRHRHKWFNEHNFRLRGRDKISNGFEVHKKLLDRLQTTRWSEEVCWRLEREYWLRFMSHRNRNKTHSLNKQLNRLLPKSIESDGRIYSLRNIAFPSVLEALSGSGLVKRKKDDPNTLNQGFLPHEKRCRHSTLTYQHRMHPDISRFPRQQFYSHDHHNRSLLDGSKVVVDRSWSYNAYPSRSCWLNVEGKVFKNRNNEEVKVSMKELDHFCKWASQQTNHDYDAAILTFYKGQEMALRESLRKLTGNSNAYSRFTHHGINVKLATVDFFQGQEADLVILSMVNTQRDGFMDSPNRLNVSITRARYQLLVVGHYSYFANRSRTRELNALAKACSLLRMSE